MPIWPLSPPGNNYSDFCAFPTPTVASSGTKVEWQPLTQLSSTASPFIWTPKAEKVSTRLKELLTSAPVFSHQDPTHQFITKVDASATGVGAVLS